MWYTKSDPEGFFVVLFNFGGGDVDESKKYGFGSNTTDKI